MTGAARFDPSTPEEAIAAWVESCPPTPDGRAAVAALLAEQHPLYAGRSTNETARIRGYALAAFERIGLPDQAWPCVLNELQNGDEAYLVAAAAKALRGASSPAAVAFAAPFLAMARDNIRYADAPLTFDTYTPRRPATRGTTAAEEIGRTVAWLGDVGCCDAPAPPSSPTRALALADVTLEDQDGARMPFGSFFSGKPSVVAFFYSRCDNVRKCSLTVTRLAALQRALDSRGLAGRVRLSAITYDPGFDGPARLASYGRERGVAFGEDVRFFRVPAGFDDVRAAFDLGVNYAGAIVNRHRIELYVLDRRGRVAASFTHLAWSEGEVVECLERVLRAPSWLGAARASAAGAASVLVVLLPKCPLCLGAYASALGMAGLQLAPYRSWLLPAAIVLVLAHLLMMARRARRTRRLLPLCVSAAGTLALVAGAIAWEQPVLAGAGAALTIAGAVMNAMPRLARRPGQGFDAGSVKPTTWRITPSLFVRM